MTVREKTIHVPVNFGNPADLVDATLTTLGTPTVYIPEKNTGGSAVTFTSVAMFVTYQDVSTATGATLSEFRANVSVNGAGATTFTELDDLANTGENIAGVIGPINFTSHFNTNYGNATSRTCQVQAYFDISTGTGVNVRGVYAWLEITYTYDDASASAEIKTICYPLSEISGALTTTANTAAGTIPQLTGAGGILPENTPVIRHSWVVIRGNANNNAGTTGIVLTYGFDGAGGGGALPTVLASLASDTYHTFLVDVSALSSTASHTFDLWSATATRFHNVIVELWVTYEFTISGTTRVLNYIEQGIDFNSPIAGTTSADSHRWKKDIIIPEPGTITTRRKTVEIRYGYAAAATAQIKVGSQASYRAYASVHSVSAGMSTFVHRFDSGSSGGDGQTLARGENPITVDIYRSAGAMLNVSGKIKLLYESDVATDGIGAHSHVVRKIFRQIDFTAVTEANVTSLSFAIPESDYWIRNASLDVFFWGSTATGTLLFMARRLTGEGPESGWEEIYQDRLDQDAEVGPYWMTAPMGSKFMRHPNDPDTSKLDIEASRTFRYAGPSIRYGAMWCVVYHSILFDFAGTVSGSGGGTVNINVCRADTGEKVASTSRTGNGAYTAVVHDDFVNYYAEAREGANYLGRSDNTVGA